MSHNTLTVFENPDFPFTIELRGPEGFAVKSYPRAAFSTRDDSIDDVMSGENQDPRHREAAIEANRKQLEEVRLEAAGPDLLAAGIALVDKLRGMAIHPSHYADLEAAIAKAKGGAL